MLQINLIGVANDRIKDTYIHIIKAVTDTMDNKIHLTQDIRAREREREKLIK